MESELKIDSNGSKIWYLNGKKHRENGPAIIYPDGIKFWYKYGELIKVLYDGKEYKAGYNPCELCLVKPMCNKYCKLKHLFLWY